jgi:hypothetical protein
MRVEVEEAMTDDPAAEAGTAAPLRHSVLYWAVAIFLAVTAFVAA